MSSGEDPTVRVGNNEREAAIAALGEQWRAGRLDPTEHERRTTAAHSAATRGDLDALFADLPGGWSSGTALAGTEGAAPVAAQPRGQGGLFPDGSWVAQHRSALMGLTPFVALALFFITKQWVFFLLIPAMGAVLYAGDRDESRSDRDKRRGIERGD